MAGVTNAGFVPKRLNEIIASLKDNAKPIFQDLVKPGEEVDVSDTSTIGRLIGLIAIDMDELWQGLQQVYQAFDPNSAAGVALDNIVQYIGITRQEGKPTVIRGSVWGQTGTYLPQGQVVTNGNGDRFISTTALTFAPSDMLGFAVRPSTLVVGEESGFTFISDEGIFSVAHVVQAGDTEADVLQAWADEISGYTIDRMTFEIENGNLYCVVKDYYAYVILPSNTNSVVAEVKKRLSFNSEAQGDIPAPLNTVTSILTPVYGWLSVTNEISAEKGSAYETDEELRARFRQSKAVRANNTSEALYSQLLELEDVDAVRIYENMTEAVDTRGLPEHSFMAVVRGGVDTNIGEIVWNNKPLGIQSYGNDSVVIRDSQNIEQTVYYTRAIPVPVYVSVEVTKTNNSLPDNAVEMIRASIVEYINSSSDFGENVIYTRLFTPINAVPGHQVDELKIGITSNPTGQSNLPMNYDQYPVTSPEFVEVILNS